MKGEYMPEEPAHRERIPVAAFVLSLLSGIWMLMPGIMLYVWRPEMIDGGMQGGWMWRHGMMHGVTSMVWWPWFGVIAGVLVLIGAALLYSKPRQSRSSGLVIVILAALNLFLGMGGFVASVLGIIGGALALAWRPEPSTH
jgi:hypothetical protein